MAAARRAAARLSSGRFSSGRFRFGRSHAKRYRRRRRLPLLAILVLLAAGTGYVWSQVLESTADPSPKASCNVPARVADSRSDARPAGQTSGANDGQVPTAAAGPPGRGSAVQGAAPVNAAAGPADAAPRWEPVSRDAMMGTSAAAPKQVQFRVLNANGDSGQGNFATLELADLGFSSVDKPSNDPLYPEFDLSCYGQLRFGPNGERAARTLSMVLPCVQLVRDGRSESAVDVALGTEFEEVRPSSEATRALEQLSAAADPEQAQQAVRELAESADVHC